MIEWAGSAVAKPDLSRVKTSNDLQFTIAIPWRSSAKSPFVFTLKTIFLNFFYFSFIIYFVLGHGQILRNEISASKARVVLHLENEQRALLFQTIAICSLEGNRTHTSAAKSAELDFKTNFYQRTEGEACRPPPPQLCA